MCLLSWRISCFDASIPLLVLVSATAVWIVGPPRDGYRSVVEVCSNVEQCNIA